MSITQIKQRDGSTTFFLKEKLIESINNILKESKEGNVEEIVDGVVDRLSKLKFDLVEVDSIQNIIEEVFIEKGLKKTAKLYISQRKNLEDLRSLKEMIGVKDNLNLDFRSAYLLENRYLLRDQNNKIVETPSEMFQRVAKAVALADRLFGQSEERVEQLEKDFFDIMTKFDFLPNSPTLINAGKGNLIASYALYVEDSIKGIYKALFDSALIHQSGGGVGFSFSKLRPKDDLVYSTMRKSAGPLSFMRIFDSSFESVVQAGKRKGANMAVLRIDHPDIINYICSKDDNSFMKNFNLSVGLTDKFISAVENDERFDLISPKTNKVVRNVMARDLWKLMILNAWKHGDPGVLFLDKLDDKKLIETTSACGEVPLFSYESCPLGSINLSNFVINSSIDWDRLKSTVHKAVHFLDNVIEVNKYSVSESEILTKNNRKVGLGVMGFADMLIQLGIPYNSQKTLNLIDDLMRFIRTEAENSSMILAEKRKPYTNSQSTKNIRNSKLLAISPTGSISIIANCSSGIEPLFAISYSRNIAGQIFLETNKYFEKIAKERGFYSEDLMVKIAKTGSIQNIADIPYDIKRLFVTAFDIEPEWHVRVQEVFQKHVDNAVSKTVLLQNDAKPEDVEKVFTLAYKLGCKGITVYRYGSREDQVMFVG